MKAFIAGILVVILLGAGVLVLLLTGLLAVILLAIGILVFIIALATIAVAAIAFLIAIPYYFVAKKAETRPGTYRLEQVKEK